MKRILFFIMCGLSSTCIAMEKERSVGGPCDGHPAAGTVDLATLLESNPKERKAAWKQVLKDEQSLNIQTLQDTLSLLALLKKYAGTDSRELKKYQREEQQIENRITKIRKKAPKPRVLVTKKEEPDLETSMVIVDEQDIEEMPKEPDATSALCSVM